MNKLFLACLMAGALALVGCSDSDDNNNGSNPPDPEKPTTYSDDGVSGKGPLNGAKISGFTGKATVDLGLTDKNGKFKFSRSTMSKLTSTGGTWAGGTFAGSMAADTSIGEGMISFATALATSLKASEGLNDEEAKDMAQMIIIDAAVKANSNIKGSPLEQLNLFSLPTSGDVWLNLEQLVLSALTTLGELGGTDITDAAEVLTNANAMAKIISAVTINVSTGGLAGLTANISSVSPPNSTVIGKAINESYQSMARNGTVTQDAADVAGEKVEKGEVPSLPAGTLVEITSAFANDSAAPDKKRISLITVNNSSMFTNMTLRAFGMLNASGTLEYIPASSIGEVVLKESLTGLIMTNVSGTENSIPYVNVSFNTTGWNGTALLNASSNLSFKATFAENKTNSIKASTVNVLIPFKMQNNADATANFEYQNLSS